MMNQPKLYTNQHQTPISDCKTDGTGFDFESILGRTDGTVLVVGLEGGLTRERRR